MILLLSLNVTATETRTNIITYEQEIRDCSAKLYMCVQLGTDALNKADEALKSQQLQLDMQKKIIIEQRNELDAWYRKPEVLLLTGVILGTMLKR